MVQWLHGRGTGGKNEKEGVTREGRRNKKLPTRAPHRTRIRLRPYKIRVVTVLKILGTVRVRVSPYPYRIARIRPYFRLHLPTSNHSAMSYSANHVVMSIEGRRNQVQTEKVQIQHAEINPYEIRPYWGRQDACTVRVRTVYTDPYSRILTGTVRSPTQE